MKHIFVGKWIPGMGRFLGTRYRNEINAKARIRLKWWDWYVQHGTNISRTARHFGISRNTLYRWLRRFRPGCLSSLENQSTRPKNFRMRTVRLRTETRVYELRALHPRYGKKKIQILMNREGHEISESSVGRLLHEKGFPDARKKLKKSGSYRRTNIVRHRRPKGVTLSRPGQVIQMDSVFIQHNGKKLAIITAIDLATRVAFADIFATPNARGAWKVLFHFQKLLRTIVESVHTDNGSEFLGVFHRNCETHQVRHYFSPPRTPKNHAHIERFNRTLQDEGIHHYHLSLPEEKIREQLNAFLVNYNMFRPHQALHYLTPIRYYLSKRYPSFSSSPEVFKMYWTNTLTCTDRDFQYNIQAFERIRNYANYQSTRPQVPQEPSP